MRNLKFPCLKCKKSVKNNQKGLQCNNCELWVHQKCTTLTGDEYAYLEQNEEEPYYCEVVNLIYPQKLIPIVIALFCPNNHPPIVPTMNL